MTIHLPVNERSQQLTRLEDARRNLAAAQSVEDVKAVRDCAESVRAYAQSYALGLDVMNIAAELKLQSERVGGRILTSLKLRGGDRRSMRTRVLRLSELGLDKNQSSRWQLLATVPESLFQQYVQTAHREGREISSAALLKLARRLRTSTLGDVIADVAPVPNNGVGTASHLSDAAIQPSDPWGSRLEELREMISEIRNHYRILNNLIESVSDRARLTPDSTDARAIRRYQAEIGEHLRTVDEGLRRLVRATIGQPVGNRHLQSP